VPVNPETTEREGRSAVLLLGGLIVLTVALRFWRLGEWNFQATEMFTLRDSVSPQFRNPRPLGYLLNYYVVRPFLPLDEFGLRLLPAVFGVLAIPASYLVGRRLIGTRAALFSALLMTLSPLLVMYSQLARYWSLVLLLSAIYPYALYIGVRDRNRGALVLGLVTGLLAVLAHPVSALLGGGPALLLLAHVRREHLTRLWSHKGVRWAALALVVFAVLVAVRLIPLLQSWVTQHDRNPASGQFLLRPPVAKGLKQIFYLLAFVESLTVPVVLGAAAGLYVLWKERDRALGLYMGSLAIFPIVFLTLLSLRTPVSTYYLLPTVPVFFLGAGVFLDRLFQVDWKLRPQWLLPAVVTAGVVAAGMPSLISEYRNGRRYDFRAMAHWLEPRLGPADVVVSDQPMVLDHYLPGPKVQRLQHDTTPLAESVRVLRESGRGGTLWVVAPAPSHAFRTALKQGGLAAWLYENCQLGNTAGRGRVDFRSQYLQAFRCPPVASPSTSSEAASAQRTGR
jgi:hypothetical protein